MLAIELPEEIDRRLERLARMTGRSKADTVREAVLEYLEDWDDFLIAEERMEQRRAGLSRTYTLDEVERDLDLAD